MITRQSTPTTPSEIYAKPAGSTSSNKPITRMRNAITAIPPPSFYIIFFIVFCFLLFRRCIIPGNKPAPWPDSSIMEITKNITNTTHSIPSVPLDRSANFILLFPPPNTNFSVWFLFLSIHEIIAFFNSPNRSAYVWAALKHTPEEPPATCAQIHSLSTISFTQTQVWFIFWANKNRPPSFNGSVAPRLWAYSLPAKNMSSACSSMLTGYSFNLPLISRLIWTNRLCSLKYCKCRCLACRLGQPGRFAA